MSSASPRRASPRPASTGVQHFSQEQRRLIGRPPLEGRPAQEGRPGARHGQLPEATSSGTVSTSYGRSNRGGYTTDTNNPPLYYFANAVVYHLSPWTALPDRVHMMRLFSALLAACTVLLIFLFLRELIPSTSWAWTVGALAVAFQPMFAFTSSGVTSDCFLYLASAGIFYTFALAFRRGLTVRIGLAYRRLRGHRDPREAQHARPGSGNHDRAGPAGDQGAEEATRRGTGRSARGGRRGAGTARRLHAAQLDRLGPRPLLRPKRRPGPVGIAVPGGGGATTNATLGDAFNYMWQFYLPRLPSMHSIFPVYPAARDLVQRLHRAIRLARLRLPTGSTTLRSPSPPASSRSPGGSCSGRNVVRSRLPGADHLSDADRGSAGPDRGRELHRPVGGADRLRAAALPASRCSPCTAP